MISVIIPVYNAEKYLERCIKSVVNQSYKNLEIILINDGSTDDSDKICDKWSKLDTRINIIHKVNEGVSVARNTGLDVATGEYIAFVDSDDYIREDYINKLLEYIIKFDVDISCCKYVNIDENVNEIKSYKNDDRIMCDEVILGEDYIINVITNNTLPVMWNKLYKRKIFDNLRFERDVLAEDYLILLKMINKEHRIVFTDEVLYYYLIRNNSLTSGFNKKFNLDRVNHIFENEEFLINKFGESIFNSVKTAQLRMICFYFCLMPYSHITIKDEDYLYVYKLFIDNKKYINKSDNRTDVKLFLLLYIVSARVAKKLVDVMERIIRYISR